MFRKLSALPLFLLVFASTSHAQTLWSDVAERDIPLIGERRIVPQKCRIVRLDAVALQPLLAAAPERFTPAAEDVGQRPVLTLPMPDGNSARFRLTESPMMASALQAQYPNIRCYTGRGIDDPTALLKCDWTPRGFHAMVISATHSTMFIDPYSQGDTEHYSVYFKKDYLPQKNDLPFACETETAGLQQLDLNTDFAPDAQGDCQIRRYRLALACTGEYTTFHGGTVALALAALNTTMNRVNGIYENDFAITMQLVPNNNLLVYLNAGTDPYSNGSVNTMLGQNQTNCNTVIGAANYDIGHVFGAASGGGVAWLGVVCSTDKARGVTTRSAPIGDAFDVDYVAHEMGHQFGGNHTFNGTTGSCSGNAEADVAVEPGSGSTIMAYAGICGAQNVQSNSDDYFHSISIQEINAYVVTGNGNTCPLKIASGNSNPTVSAGPNRTIPKSTPFALTATGNDTNGDTLTYCWEQIDAALSTNPPSATSTSGPLFRSFKGTTSPTRWFPRLSDLVSNTNYPWEELPGVARTMNFRVTARDNNDGAGCTNEDDVLLTVSSNSGPFTVTAPNTNVLWIVGDTQTVTWDMSNTTAAPVSCANVRILLSTDGGFNYPVVLAASVPNTGSANVMVPNNLSNTCRVKVEAVGNIFFDISNQNFRIQLPPVPTFTLNAAPNLLQACAGDTVSFTANLAALNGFNNQVQLSVSGAPAGASVQIAPNPLPPTGSAVVNISGLTPAMAGNYNLTVQGTSGSIVQTANIQLSVLPGVPASAAATSPLDGASVPTLIPVLTWNTVPFAENYFVETATNPAFSTGSVVLSQTLGASSAQTPTLQPGTVYYWRVRSINDCGESAFSQVYAFQTGNLNCDQIFISTDVPKTIATTVNSVVSTLNVPVSKNIADVNVTLLANHTYVGDLDARLVAPWGDTVLLFDRPGMPATPFGCPSNNLNLIFDSQATLGADSLENLCSSVFPALLGIFRPTESLDVLNGQNAQGIWEILLADNQVDDGGSLTAWSLTFCFADSVQAGSLLTNTLLTVPAGGSGTIANSNLALALSGTAAQSKFTLLSLPQHGTLKLNGNPLAFGGTFTQADIDANFLVYNHNGNNATADDFKFDAIDLNNFAWVHNATLNIVIVQNNLAAAAAQTQPVLCHNGATGQITVAATGLNGQYQYSLNGGPAQSSNVFGGLAAGAYMVVVTGQFGFTATTNQVVLTNPVAISASTSVTDDDMTVTASGGTGNFEYSLNGMNFQAFNLFQNLANGIYTVTVRDANGCTATAQAIVAVNTLLATLEIQKPVSCTGGSDGEIFVTVGGGQMPYSYSLNGGAFQPGNSFADLAAGIYLVEVKDNQGFTIATNTVTLTDPPVISVSASAALNVITVVASGGTGNFEYSLDGANFQNQNTFGNLANGDYTVTVRDENGCTATAQTTVNVPPLVIVSVSQMQAILCFGDLTGVLQINAAGGVPPYEYSLNGGPFQSGNAFANLGAGSHLVKVRDAAGTEQQTFVDLSQPAQLAAAVDVSGNDATFFAIGGTPPYSYQLNGPLPPVNLPNGDYTLLVTDANGCTATADFTVNVPLLTASIEVVSIDPCVPSATIEVAATGGEPPYEYSLNGGPFQSGNIFTFFGGPNNVRVRDALGVIVQVPVNVTLPQPVQAAATTAGDTIFASAQFGEMPYLFSIDGIIFQASPEFPDLPNGTYVVTVKDNNGCVDTTSVTIHIIGTVEPGEVWGLVISPNPSGGLFQITMFEAPAEFRAEVFDAAGRNLRTLGFTPNGGQFSTTLDLQDLPQGIYLLRLTDGRNQGSARLSIIR